MKKDLFEKSKQAVAEENGYSDWGQVLRICDYEDVYRMMDEVFKHGCNEAVKEERKVITLRYPYTFSSDIMNRPLPFPEAQKINRLI